MKKHLMILLLAVCVLLCGCGSSKNAPAANASPAAAASPVSDSAEIIHAEIVIRDYGTVRIAMDPAQAPGTVANFVKLVNEGFYDGLTFHRIIEGFMMQGGDPTGTGSGSSSEKIQGEFSANGIANSQSHVRGAVSMARANDMNSASCQFFIVHKDSTFLDGQYACFGYVTEGMDVVDAVCENTPVLDSNGSVAPENQPVIESIRILEE